jgi:thiol-disulfide isomerase/thioredoxin
MSKHGLNTLLVGAGLLMAVSSANAASEMKWAKSFDAAMASARSSNKLVMVDFYTDWCGWCKRLDKDTYTNAKVIQLSDQVIPVKVNAEKEGIAVAKKYGVTQYPTILFINTSGQKEGAIGGYLPPEGFSGEMTKFVTLHKEFPGLVDGYKSNPNNAAIATKLSAAYAGRGEIAKAESVLAQAEKLGPTIPELAKAYNAIGDSYQEAKQFDKAVPLFQKAARVGKDPHDVSYARISLVDCYMNQGNVKSAKAELEAVQKMPNLPADMKEAASQMAAAIKAAPAK